MPRARGTVTGWPSPMPPISTQDSSRSSTHPSRQQHGHRATYTAVVLQSPSSNLLCPGILGHSQWAGTAQLISQRVPVTRGGACRTLAVTRLRPSQTRPSEGTEVGVRHPLPRKMHGGAWVLTGSVEVDHEAALHVLLDQLQRPLEYLAGARLLHGVGVPWVAEQGQQVVRGAWAAGAVGAGGKRGQSETEITGTQRQNCA